MDKGVKGLEKLLKKLNNLSKEVTVGLDQLAEGTSREIQLDAVQRAPVNDGNLRQSIKQNPLGDLKYEVVVGADYGPYVEFGTGPKVQVPAEFADMAQQFKGKGSGSYEDGLKSIKDWCRSKGIEESAAYPIFMSLIKNGQRPQPYLYPAFVKGRIQFLQDVNKLLKDSTK